MEERLIEGLSDITSVAEERGLVPALQEYATTVTEQLAAEITSAGQTRMRVDTGHPHAGPHLNWWHVIKMCATTSSVDRSLL